MGQASAEAIKGLIVVERDLMEALILFSLSPEALFKAAQNSDGTRVEVDKPLQLIIYGVPEAAVHISHIMRFFL